MIALCAGQVWAAEGATISVTVSLEERVEVSLDNGTWNIGPIALGGSSAPATFTATNNGTVAADFSINATNGAGGWTLAAAGGADAFAVSVADPAIFLTLADQLLATNVATNATKDVAMTYRAPTSDTKGGGVDQSFGISITASKHVP